MKKPKVPAGLQLWIDARKRHGLSHAHVQMAHELGMDPKKLGKLDNHRQEPWKLPLPQFIEELYLERYGRERPARVLSVEERARELAGKKAARREARLARKAATAEAGGQTRAAGAGGASGEAGEGAAVRLPAPAARLSWQASPMSETRAWPEISWKDSRLDEESIRNRIEIIALQVRRFELALEAAGEAEVADLSGFEPELDAWDRSAAPVFAHTGLGEGLPLVASELPALARALEAACSELGAQRSQLLEKLGPPVAARVLELEATVLLEAADLWAAPPADLAESEGEAYMLAGEPEPLLVPPAAEALEAEVDPGAPVESLPQRLGGSGSDVRERLGAEPEPERTSKERLGTPVRGEELRMRQLAEAKPLPEDDTLGALLALLPSEWIGAVAAHLELTAPVAKAHGSRTTRLQAAVHAHLRDPGSLRALVAGLGEPERKLLAALLRADGPLPHGAVAAAFGLDEADGFYWSGRPTSGPLSRLRRSGLVFVGARENQAQVAVPSDLAAELRALLALD